MNVPLTRGYVAVIDDEDWPLVSKYKWCADVGPRGHVYAVNGGNKAPKLLMHRLILPPRPGLYTDHVDGNGLNNRRSNLRYATPLQNVVNSFHPGKLFAASIYRGVSASGPRWRARMRTEGGRKINLGTFDTQEQAARAYDAAARERYGEFAVVNFP